MSRRKVCPQCGGSTYVTREFDADGNVVPNCGRCDGLGYIGGRRPKKVAAPQYAYMTVDLPEEVYFSMLRICYTNRITLEDFAAKAIAEELKRCKKSRS
jgi:hypothetical protein